MQNEHRELIVRSLDDELKAEEQMRLHQILEVEDAARVELDALRSVRTLLAREGGGSMPYGFSSRVMARIARHSNGRARPKASGAWAWLRANGGWRWSVAAAALAALVLVMVLRGSPSEIEVPFGKTQLVELEDGTAVELASGSRLQHGTFDGQSERRVLLKGEAFFAVAPGAAPFLVETFNARVVVHGTRFNVRAWHADPERATVVTVESGRVELAPRARQVAGMALHPGESSAVFGDSGAVVERVPIRVGRALAWRSGGLAFSDQPLESVFRSLERRFDVRIEIENATLRHRPLTYLNPRPASATEVVSDICSTHGLHYRRTARGFVISAE